MKLSKWFYHWAIWRDTRGQDMVEYALLAGFVAVAAAATFPPMQDSISVIFSKMISLTDRAGA
jgi:pilus assembly protein Flp/PilA